MSWDSTSNERCPQASRHPESTNEWPSLSLPKGYRLFVLLGVVGLGVLQLPSAITGLLNGYHSAGWPHVSGVIVSSEASNDCAGGDCLYYLDVKYDFVVKGVKSESEWKEDWSFEWFRNRAAESYPAGRPISVYYDPDNPSTSIMEQGITLKQLADVLFLLLFISLMGLRVFYGREDPAETESH